MAVFISAGERRRRFVVGCVLSALVALVVGLFAGRASVPTVRERAASVAMAGSNLATRVDALTIEYEQAISGGGDTVTKGVDEPLTGIETELTRALKSAPWITSTRVAELRAATAKVRAAATAKVSAEEFASATSAASTLIRSSLGVR